MKKSRRRIATGVSAPFRQGSLQLALLHLIGALLVPMSAAHAAGVVYVNAAASSGGDGLTWTSAFSDLQLALAASRPDDELWVVEGEYKPDSGSGDQSLSFTIGHSLSIYGGFAGGEVALDDRDPSLHVTILSGDLLGNDTLGDPVWSDNSLHVVHILPSVLPVLVDGVTIKGGNAKLEIGGGILNEGGLKLVGCTVRQNRAGNPGGGVGNLFGALLAQSCDFISDKTPTGGGAAYGFHAPMVFEDCLFTENGGGAIRADGGYLTVRRSRIVGNTSSSSGAGVITFGTEETLIEGCIIAGNSTSMFSAGGIWSNDDKSLTVRSSTVYANAVGVLGAGAGLFASAAPGTTSKVTIESSIIWGNTSAAPSIDEFTKQLFLDVSVKKLQFSTVSGDIPIEFAFTNDNVDPHFIDPVGADLLAGTQDDDLRLSAQSPAIDAGDPEDFAVWTDFAGQPRPQDGNLDGILRVDRGSYEYCSGTLSATSVVTPGGDIHVTIDLDQAGVLGYVLVGIAEGEAVLPPFGVSLVSLVDPWILLPMQVGGLQAKLDLHVPTWITVPLGLFLQGVVIAVPTGGVNCTNLQVTSIEG